MKTRILYNWRTTLAGLFILAVAGMLWGLGVITRGELLALMPSVAGLLFVPDSVLKRNSKTKKIIP